MTKKKPTKKKQPDRSVGGELVQRLKRFSEALEPTDDLSTRFTVRSVRIVRPQTYSPEMVRSRRQLLQASQAIFAQFLGVSASAVRDWEQGLKPPSGAACRLMDEIEKSPAYFRARLQELVATPS